VLDKAMSVLSALAAGPATLAQVVQRTGVPRATAHRLATALEAHRLVERDGTGRFCLGSRLAELGAAATTHRPLADVARPALEALRDATGESVQLYVPRGDARVCIASLESPHSLRTIVPVGASLPMDKGSAAKVLSGDERVIRRGWAETVEEREKGVASVSAPVRAGAQVVAAVSVSGPIERTTRTPGRRYADAVVAAAERISQSLT
jgi:DNA-binding IclR family transcriptional regulator